MGGLPALYPEGDIHQSPGSRRKSRTLGFRPPRDPTLKGLYTRWLCVEPLQGSSREGDLTQGALPAVATLDCDVSPLQGAEPSEIWRFHVGHLVVVIPLLARHFHQQRQVMQFAAVFGLRDADRSADGGERSTGDPYRRLIGVVEEGRVPSE